MLLLEVVCWFVYLKIVPSVVVEPKIYMDKDSDKVKVAEFNYISLSMLMFVEILKWLKFCSLLKLLKFVVVIVVWKYLKLMNFVSFVDDNAKLGPVAPSIKLS